jgi:hypothetical protein
MSIIRHILLVVSIMPILSWAETTTSPASASVGKTLPTGLTGFGFPLVESDLMVGTAGTYTAITDGSGNARLSLPVTSAALPSSVLVAGRAYYLEVTGGALEGERFEIDAVTTQTLAAGRVALDLTSTRSTLAAVSAASLNACPLVIRPHLTLAKVQGMFSPALVGNNNSAVADAVLVYSTGGFTTYYLRGDNLTWRKAGSTSDFSGLVIAPEEGVLVQLRSGAKVMTHAGVPRMNDFRLNMKAGYMPGCTGFAVDMSPLQFGAVTNAGPAPQNDWVGNNVQASADGIQVFDPAKASFTSYYLRADGTSWRTAGSTTVLTGSALLKPDTFFLVKRANPNPAHLILRPY